MKLPREHKYKYTMTPNAYGTTHHSYQIVTRHGAIEFNVTDYDKDGSMKEYASEPSGGLEAHYRVPPHYMEDQAPSHAKCHALQAPCWHDGTSLYASEVLIPQWRMRSNEMEVFEFLLSEVGRLAPEVPEPEEFDNPVDILVAMAKANGFALEGVGIDNLRKLCTEIVEEEEA